MRRKSVAVLDVPDDGSNVLEGRVFDAEEIEKFRSEGEISFCLPGATDQDVLRLLRRPQWQEVDESTGTRLTKVTIGAVRAQGDAEVVFEKFVQTKTLGVNCSFAFVCTQIIKDSRNQPYVRVETHATDRAGNVNVFSVMRVKNGQFGVNVSSIDYSMASGVKGKLSSGKIKRIRVTMLELFRERVEADMLLRKQQASDMLRKASEISRSQMTESAQEVADSLLLDSAEYKSLAQRDKQDSTIISKELSNRSLEVVRKVGVSAVSLEDLDDVLSAVLGGKAPLPDPIQVAEDLDGE